MLDFQSYKIKDLYFAAEEKKYPKLSKYHNITLSYPTACIQLDFWNFGEKLNFLDCHRWPSWILVPGVKSSW